MSVYTPTVWKNNATPAINGNNLNKMEAGVKSAHVEIDEIVSGTTKVASASHADTADEASRALVADTAGPTGTIITFGGLTAPTGYLECNGSAVSQTVYADLYAVIGNAWDTTGGVAAPAAGFFRLPPSDIGGRGLYMRGKGSVNGGVGTYQEDVFKAHSHGSSATLAALGTRNLQANGSNHYHSTGAATISNTGDATETRPITMTVLLCIKT